MPIIHDVAVIGGGIAGASFAYRVAGRRSLVVLEREAHVGYHATGRSAAEFSRQFQSAWVGLLAEGSYPFFATPPDGFTAIDLLIPRGNLVIAGPERADRVAPALAEVRLTSPDARRVSVEEAVAMVPFLDGSQIAGAFYDPWCWDMEVDALLQGYLRAARHAGAEVLTNRPIEAITREGEAYRLDTPAGPIFARTIVDAAGAWADDIAAMAGLPRLGLTPMRRTAITVDGPPGLDLTSVPGVNEIDEDYYFKPEGGRILASAADATPSEPCDAAPEEIDVATAAYALEQATTLNVRRISHKWAGLRTFAPDHRQVVGFSGLDPDFFWLAGQGGSGILTSPALSAWAAGLFLDGRPPDDLVALGLAPDFFSPRRLEA